VSKVLRKNEKWKIKINHRGLRDTLCELVENIFLRINLWKKILYAVEFFLYPDLEM
jgi:hypothetical protein